MEVSDAANIVPSLPNMSNIINDVWKIINQPYVLVLLMVVVSVVALLVFAYLGTRGNSNPRY